VAAERLAVGAGELRLRADELPRERAGRRLATRSGK
jgi:hypothetical protein